MLSRQSPLSILLLAVAVYANAQFDNALREAPKIDCGHGSISLEINTNNAPPSYVFAKGHFNKKDCSFRNATHVTFNFDDCNVNRKREVNPKGMAFTMTVVVQLHHLFITKVDRAYNVRCFYMEAEKSVGTEMDVSDLTTIKLQSEHEMPTCMYTLHKDSANGPLVKYARVGDLIYHVWDCPSPLYSMLIHSCNILDGQGNEHRVIDENGCSTDSYLMPELVYSKDLTKTFTASNAFNFPDQSSVYFNCRVKLCLSSEEDCSRVTPPHCGTTIPPSTVTEQFPTPAHLPSDNEHPQNRTSLGDELDDDQLITNTPETESTTTVPTVATTQRVQTTVTEHSEGTTTVIHHTTTVLPLSTSTPSPSTTRAPVVSTTIVLPTEAFPKPSALPNEPFPKPETIRDFLVRKYNETEVVDEGSGLEISAHEPHPITILTGEPHSTAPKREIRRRDTPNTVDVDITSPEITIFEKDYELPEALHSADPLHPASHSTGGHEKNNVCIPLIGFWVLSGLIIACLAVVTVVVCKAQYSYRQKFIPY